MAPSRLGIVTASTDIPRAGACLRSWAASATSTTPLRIHIVPGRTEEGHYKGTVGAFREGIDHLLQEPDLAVIACLHDDVELLERGWDERVMGFFLRHSRAGLLGFGGALALGADDLYDQPYDPMRLARQHFRSNLLDAEAHGIRSLVPERVACLDGFSQVGRREFWEGFEGPLADRRDGDRQPTYRRPWTELKALGIIHHFYDGLLGCLAARHGWETWYLPVRCRHYGGRTAVGDPGYQRWAEQAHGGDRQIWEQSHRIGYEAFRDVLPLRVAQ